MSALAEERLAFVAADPRSQAEVAGIVEQPARLWGIPIRFSSYAPRGKALLVGVDPAGCGGVFYITDYLELWSFVHQGRRPLETKWSLGAREVRRYRKQRRGRH